MGNGKDCIQPEDCKGTRYTLGCRGNECREHNTDVQREYRWRSGLTSPGGTSGYTPTDRIDDLCIVLGTA